MEWNFTMKVVLISSCVVSMGLAMRVSVPLALEFMASHAPLLWSSVVSWLRPPYLYVVINVIILGIAASSRFHHHHHDHDQKSSEDYDHHDHDRDNHHLGYHDHEQKVNKVISSDFRMMEDDRTMVMFQRGEEEEEEFSDVDDDVQVKTIVAVNSTEEVKDVDNHDDDDQEELMMVLRSEEEEKIVLSPERPLSSVSSRFGDRKPVKTSPEGGKALKVTSKPKRQHQTLESTWKAIMEGRSMSFTRQVKKWDHNLENQGRQIIGFGDLELDQAPSEPTMMKSETFKDRTNQELPSVSTTHSKLIKEPSLSQDELNTRVEAFIKKFNEQMRLQRQESLNQYMEMINRGSH